MPARSDPATPNHDASVAAYWSTEVDGIHLPLFPVSCGPPSARVGKVPYIALPFTAPPRIIWWPPHAWSVPAFDPGCNVRLNSDRVNAVTLFGTPNSFVD